MLRTGKADQAFGARFEPLAMDLATAPMLVFQPGTRQPFRKPQIACARLRQQQRTIRLVSLGFVGDPDVATEDRLDARRPSGLVKLDHREHVRKVGDRQRGHPVKHRGADGIIDAQHTVRDRIFRVQPQMDKTG